MRSSAAGGMASDIAAHNAAVYDVGIGNLRRAGRRTELSVFSVV